MAPATCSVAVPEAVIAALLDIPAAKIVPEPVIELLTVRTSPNVAAPEALSVAIVAAPLT